MDHNGLLCLRNLIIIIAWTRVRAQKPTFPEMYLITSDINHRAPLHTSSNLFSNRFTGRTNHLFIDLSFVLEESDTKLEQTTEEERINRRKSLRKTFFLNLITKITNVAKLKSATLVSNSNSNTSNTPPDKSLSP